MWVLQYIDCLGEINLALWVPDFEHMRTSYLLLGMLVGVGLAGGVLFRIGLVGVVLRCFGYLVRVGIRGGFGSWERLLGWASWQQFMAVTGGFLLAGGLVGGWFPVLRIVCGVALLIMGASACIAYMFIDLERNEVERGYKSIHNPMKGQLPAENLKRYGKQVGVPLLIAATVAAIGGFALLNQGLYETVGRRWYAVAAGVGQPTYADFLASAITRVLGLIDVLDLAKSHHILGSESVRPAVEPAASLATMFKLFFTAVLLHQVFASLRQGKMLAETIADFWSPHEPIHERARNALPVYGIVAIGPLLRSLHAAGSLTKEQRDQLPLILETVGPSIIPALLRHLHDPHEHVREIAISALGRLHAMDSLHSLVELSHDPSSIVRQSVAEALGRLGKRLAGNSQNISVFRKPKKGMKRRFSRWTRWKRGAVASESAAVEPIDMIVTTLAAALEDDSTSVRTEAVTALGRIGPATAAAAPRLIALSKEADEDESFRCEVARSLGEVGGPPEATLAALVSLLDDASPEVKTLAAKAIGSLNSAAASAVQAIARLLQDREETVRTAAAEAIAQIGPLDQAAAETLVEGLASQDTVVRAQTAEALGTIGAGAEAAAPALVTAMGDENDRVRAGAVEALGKIGEAAAEAAIPGLIQALEDKDDTVSALAAHALGEMGDSADAATSALVSSLSHLNPQVRLNAARSLGLLGSASAEVQAAIEAAARDEDGGVRSEAILALGVIGGSTPGSLQLVLSGLEDADPLVRAASATSAGQWGEASEAILGGLTSLLDDPNDQVKIEVMRVLPKMAGPTPAVIDGLCRQLLEDDSAMVQAHAALALGRLGAGAVAAGQSLLHAAQTGEVGVRENAMRAIAIIQPPEATEAFAVGLRDASADVRVLASAGWMNAESVPEEAVAALLDALRDPEVRVRANAAHVMARLDAIPLAAVPLLIDCTSDPHDALRRNAAAALKRAPAEAVADIMEHLTSDPNIHVRLTAASSLLAVEASNATAGTVLAEALADPTSAVREKALDVVEALGPEGAQVLEALQEDNAADVIRD